MENWIARHANKLILAFGLLVSWSCLSIVQHGGSEIPRIVVRTILLDGKSSEVTI